MSALALSAFPYVARGRVLGANDRIGVGVIGVGGRGSSHVATVNRLAQTENLRVAAVCDVFRYRLDQVAKATGARAYMKHAELLADRRTLRMVNIPGPRSRARVRTVAQPGEQIEFEVIVAVDETRQNQSAAHVQARHAGRSA